MINFYYWLGAVVIIIQLFSVLLVLRNGLYSLSKYRKVRSWYRPKTVLIVPCKGIDLDFEKNITSFFEQEFNNYLLWFVVESEDDPAYEKLQHLRESLSQQSQALDVKIWVAGIGKICSQKIHNLLYGCQRMPDDTEVLAFADSDICVRKDWLSHLVYPLRQEKTGVASGYRWFVPKKNNLPTLALSAGNAKVAQLLGNSIFNQAWGGSMAVRSKVFRELDIPKVWQTALSDDMSLSVAVKKAGLYIAFVPACMAPSFEDTTWPKAFEFVRQQYDRFDVRHLGYSRRCGVRRCIRSCASVVFYLGAARVSVQSVCQGLYEAVCCR
jgi:ceramide glucosyltransferase